MPDGGSFAATAAPASLAPEIVMPTLGVLFNQRATFRGASSQLEAAQFTAAFSCGRAMLPQFGAGTWHHLVAIGSDLE